MIMKLTLVLIPTIALQMLKWSDVLPYYELLLIQIEEETLKFAKKLGIRTVAVIGGVSPLLVDTTCDVKVALHSTCLLTFFGRILKFYLGINFKAEKWKMM